MTGAALFAAIAESPDDPAPYLVLADALIERGDPRGDFIAVQAALETAEPALRADLRRREGEALLAHAKEWVGIGTSLRKLLVVRWKCGFLHAARQLYDGGGDDGPVPQRTAIAAFRALLDVPHIDATLAELHLGPTAEMTSDARWPSCQVFLDALYARWPAGLCRLYLNDGDLRGLHAAPVVGLRELAAKAPRLDTLVVCGRAVDAVPAIPGLRRLELRVPDLDIGWLGHVACWPDLEELVLWTDLPGRFAGFNATRFPRLRRLGLVGTRDTDTDAGRLAKLPLLGQLTHLDLSGGTLGAAGARALLPFASQLRIDVRNNLIEKARRDDLAASGLLVKPQRTGSQAMIQRDELAALEATVARRGGDRTLEPKARLKKLLAAAERGDPGWAFDARLSIARELDKAPRRDALIALARDCEVALAPLRIERGAELYIQLGGACGELGELVEAEAWLWCATREARWIRDTDAFRRAQGQIATLRMRRGDPGTAAPILERMIRYYKKANERRDEAWATRQLGNVELTRSDFAAAEVHYRRALELYKQLGSRNDQAIVLSELSSAYWSRSDYAGAEAMLREAIEMKDPDSVGLGSTYYNLGAILNGANRIDEAIAAAIASRDIFHRHRHRVGEAQALSLLGELYQRKNDHATAQTILEQALASHRATGSLAHAGITLGNLSRVALDRAEYDQARAYCEEAVEIHREVGNKYNEGMQLMGLGDAAIGQRRDADATAALEAALVPLLAINNLPGVAAVRLRLGIVEHLGGTPAAAARHYDACIADARRGNYVELAGWAEIWIAILRVQAGDRAAADALLASARSLIPADSIQGAEALAMAAAVVARLAGDPVALPEPQSWDARILATLV